MKKFELTNETKIVFGKTLYRIKSLIEVETVKIGDLGGFVEKEENLSQSDNAWVTDNAQVTGNAHIFVVGPCGSRDDYTTFYRNKDKKIEVKCGCFCGEIDKFLEKVNETHGDNKHGKVYKLAIEMAKEQIELD